MSAFMVSDEQISIILNGAIELDFFSNHLAQDFGQMFVEENIQSLLYRRTNNKRGDYEHAYVHNFDAKADLEQVYKFAKCYDYQACEHPSYKNSIVKHIIDNMCEKMIKNIVNFNETRAMIAGKWSI